MPSGASEAEEGHTDTASLTRRPVSIDALGLYVDPKRLLINSGLLPMAGGPCPCFAWALAPRPSPIADKDDIQLAEAQSWDSKYKQLWSDGINTGRRCKPQRAPDDSRLTITFGHKDTSKHWGGVTTVAICPSTNDLYTGSRDCSIKRWTQREAKRSSSKSTRSNQNQVPALYANQPPHASGSAPQTLVNCNDLLGHTGWVSALVATESLLISTSYDTTIRLWSSRSCRQVGVLTDTHTDYVLRLAAAPTAARLVSAGLRGHLHIWDLQTLQSTYQTGGMAPGSGSRRGEPMGGGYAEDGGSSGDSGPRPVQGGCVNSGSIYALDCTADGTVIAFNGPEGLVRLYDSRAGPSNCMALRGHRDNVRDLLISRDAQRLVSASSDKCIRTWDLRAPGRCVAGLRLHDDAAWALAAGDDNLDHVYSGGRDGKVFRIDTQTSRAVPVTTVPSPVLSLTVDPHRSLLWVSTPSSSLGAWNLPDASAMETAPAIDVAGENSSQSRPFRNSSGGGGLEATSALESPYMPPQPPAGLLRTISMPQHGMSAPASPPVMWLEGTPPLVRCAPFENKRHILTKDTAGVVALWDLVYGKPIKSYPPEKESSFEVIYKDLFIQFLASVPPWFTLDINQGVLSIHLGRSSPTAPQGPSAFAAEIYGVALGEDVRDDFKYNFGQHLLQAVLESLRCKASGRQDIEAYVKRSGPFAFYQDTNVNPILSAMHPHSTLRWRVAMRAFTGDELQQGILPPWVHDAVMRGKIPPMPQTHKVSFTLEAVGALRSHVAVQGARGSGGSVGVGGARAGDGGGGTAGLSFAGAPERLTAPIILEIRKVAQYVQTRLGEANLRVSIPQVSFDANANRYYAQEAGQEPHVAVLYDGRLLPWELSLNTVRRFLCSGRVTDDIPLQFMIVDPHKPPPIADVVPKQIDPEG